MVEIIGVKFRNSGRTYSFNPAGEKFSVGDRVIVNTAQGTECGTVVNANSTVDESEMSFSLKPIVRRANEQDIKHLNDRETREKEAFEICRKKIAQHGLEMKLINAELAFEGNKMTFNFTANDRIDFRELVKDLAGTFKMRIELRQIGVRDEARKLGGIGICGQPFCCSRFLDDFHPVSIKMAKEQSLSLNPEKISGVCGRLMCCLKYEQDAYEYLGKKTPRNGSLVSTPAGVGTVVDVNLLKGDIKVKTEDEQISVFNINRDEISVIKQASKCCRKKQSSNGGKADHSVPNTDKKQDN